MILYNNGTAMEWNGTSPYKSWSIPGPFLIISVGLGMDQEQARNGPGLVQGIYMTFPSSKTA